jgi:hypothetical protein
VSDGDIERIPSMRRDAKQGVPKRKPRDMAKPMAEAGKTRDAPPIVPRGMSAEPVPDEPVLDQVALDEQLLDEPMLDEALTEVPTVPMEVAPEPDPEPVALATPEPEPEPQPAGEPQPVDPNAPPLTMREMFARVEPAFAQFRSAAYAYPAEHMNDRIGDEGWTRKQMLAHIAAWHDLTTDRLIKAGMTGQPVALDREQEAINAAAARVAIGKTAGEVLKDVEATYARLRRQMLRMTDADLRLGDGWAAERIAGNTYEHYAEHIPDLVPPAPMPGSGTQR